MRYWLRIEDSGIFLLAKNLMKLFIKNFRLLFIKYDFLSFHLNANYHLNLFHSMLLIPVSKKGLVLQPCPFGFLRFLFRNRVNRFIVIKDCMLGEGFIDLCFCIFKDVLVVLEKG
jgi:hypothetical protein